MSSNGLCRERPVQQDLFQRLQKSEPMAQHEKHNSRVGCEIFNNFLLSGWSGASHRNGKTERPNDDETTLPRRNPVSTKIHMNLEIQDIEQSLNLQTPQGRKALKLALEGVKLLDKKQLDYGPKNIAAFEDNNMNLLANTVRMNDKVQRLLNLISNRVKNPHTEPQNESIEDSFADLANYAFIGNLLLSGQWEEK